MSRCAPAVISQTMAQDRERYPSRRGPDKLAAGGALITGDGRAIMPTALRKGRGDVEPTLGRLHLVRSASAAPIRGDARIAPRSRRVAGSGDPAHRDPSYD